MTNRPLFSHRNLPHLLLSARETLMQHFRPILNEAGITEQQWRVLRVLYDSNDLNAATLAHRAQVLSPSLTRMLRVLAETSLIERGPDPEDMRRQVIRLSAKGRATVVQLSPQVEAVYRVLETAIGPSLLSSLYGNIDTMIEKIERVHS